MDGPFSYYVSQLAANLRHTARVFTKATAELENGGSELERRASYHLSRGRDLIDIAHAHLSYANQLLGAAPLEFDDLPGMTTGAGPTVWVACTLLLFSVIIGLVGYIIVTYRNNRLADTVKVRDMKMQLEEKSKINNALDSLSKALFLNDRRSSESQRAIRREVGELTRKLRLLIDDTIPIDERQELKDEIATLKRNCDDANIQYYKASVIPILMGARGTTPTEKLRNAVFGNYEMPILDQSKISEVLGFKCPPDFCNFSTTEADELIGCFLPGTRPHGEISFAYRVLGCPPGPPVRPVEVLPPLTESDESDDEGEIKENDLDLTGMTFPTLLSFRPHSSESSSASSDHDDWLHDTDLFVEGYIGERLRAPYIRRTNWGSTLSLNQKCEAVNAFCEAYLKMSWFTRLSLFQLQRANMSAALDFINVAGAEAENNLTDIDIKSRSKRKLFTYQHWVTNNTVILLHMEDILREGIDMCPKFGRAAPALRDMFTTDQDTSCRRIHVNDVPCLECEKHPLCPRPCHYCSTAINLALVQILGPEDRAAPMWAVERVHDVLYYQLLCQTQYPAAEEVIFPLARSVTDKVDNSPSISRLHRVRQSQNALEVYNRRVSCSECGQTHVIKRLKMPPAKASYESLPYYAWPSFKSEKIDVVQHCPPDAFDALCELEKPFGHFLGLNSEQSVLKLKVLKSMAASGWKPASSNGKWILDPIMDALNTFPSLYISEAVACEPIGPWEHDFINQRDLYDGSMNRLSPTQ